jgi:hypothetical protein
MWVFASEGSDERIDVFGRALEDGTVAVLHMSTGEPVTRMDIDQVYPVGSQQSVKYEAPGRHSPDASRCRAHGAIHRGGLSHASTVVSLIR